MNKQEKEIILNTYKNAYSSNLQGYDKAEVLYTLKFMIDGLGLKKDRYIVENNCIAEHENMNSMQKEMYSMIFETFCKYNVYVNYKLDEIENYYDELQYQMNEEENRCHLNRVRNIQEYMKAG